jgi:hypothetical protein
MGTIRVDTAELRKFAKTYYKRSDTFTEGGKSLQYAITLILNGMPMYDGRLHLEARSDSIDLNDQCQKFFDVFREDYDSLIKTAEDFEAVDGQTVKIFEDCGEDVSSKTYLTDLGLDTSLATKPTTVVNPDGSITTTTVEIVQYPDGGVAHIVTERTTYPDGSVHEKITITTVYHLNSESAESLNEDKKAIESAILLMGGLAVDLAVGGKVVELLTKSLDFLHEALPPDGQYAAGDTLTSTLVVETDYARDGTPLQQEVTNTTTLVDQNGQTKYSDTTGIDPTGALKP